MSAGDKAKDKAQAAKGKAKEGTGRAIHDPVVEDKGKADQVSGDLKQAGEKVKDAFKR
ncbi:MAG: CsbD family protein [Acidimicrobiaceae bacterium]|nr:CsbD family protein [Acidimicrobiaceae bacterium]